MGYRCPVCDDPQADGVHLANHLAFTAMIRGGDHDAWLSERVPEWETLGEEQLAAEIRDASEQIEYSQVFEHGNEKRDHGEWVPDVRSPEADRSELSADTTEVLREARELTRKRRERDDDETSTANRSETK